MKHILIVGLLSLTLFGATTEGDKVSREGIDLPKESKEYMQMVNDSYQDKIIIKVIKNEESANEND